MSTNYSNKLLGIINRDARKILDQISLEVLSGQSLLITGGTGLLGTYLLACVAESFQSNNVEVSIVNKSNTPSHVQSICSKLGATIFQEDLTSDSALSRLPEADYIIHAAGYGQPSMFLKEPLKTIVLNTNVTDGLLRKLRNNGKFLFLSSSEVYSGSLKSPYKEDCIGQTTPLHMRAPYIESKRCGETICNIYRNLGFDVKSARLALAYGPGVKKLDKRVLNEFIQKGLGGEIELKDCGSATRTYCYVSDAIELLWKILLSGTKPVYNVGGIEKKTIAEIAEIIGEKLKVPVTYPKDKLVLDSGAPEEVCLDLTLTEKEFGKRTYVPFDDGIQRTIDWHKAL